MTEKRFIKRFEERYECGRIVSVKDNVNDKNINIKEMVDLLNALHEEIVFLKEQRHKDIDDFTEMVMEYEELEKENTELENKLWNCQNVR